MRIFSRAILAALFALNFGLCPIFASPSLAADVIFVTNARNGTIHRFSTTGDDLGVFASGLSSPLFITADQLGNIYVSEHAGPRITIFSPGGEIIGTIEIATGFAPNGVRVGSDGTIYVVVVDSNGRDGTINRYSPTGTFLGSFGLFLNLNQAEFMALDMAGNLYVTDFSDPADLLLRGMVRSFSPAGESLNNSANELFAPRGIAFDAQGNFYVASSTDATVMTGTFDSSGNIDLQPFASGIPGEDSFFGIAFDASGTLYAANFARNTIVKLRPGEVPAVFASAGLDEPSDLVIVPQLIVPQPPPIPTVKDECQQDGWQKTFDTFKTQGDCIQFVNTSK